MSIAPGARLGAYDVLAPLGAGAIGEVWRARDAVALARQVAEALDASGVARKRWTASRDGQKFLLNAAGSGTTPPPFTVVIDFPATLSAK